MSKEIIDLISICIVLFIGFIVFTFLSSQKLNHIKNYKRVSLLFFYATTILFFLYLNDIKSYFAIFSFVPLFLLLFFYFGLFLVYRLMKRYVDPTIVEKLEARKVYFASISYRYIIYKSFDIVFQQMSIVCVLVFLKNLHIVYPLLVTLFAVSFAISHLFMFQRGSLIGILFMGSAFFGGLTFPLLLNFQYGIIYTFILHWMFYITLGVLTYAGHKLHPKLKLAW